LDDFLRKLRTTILTERTVMTDFKMCSLYVVLVLPGIINLFVEYSFLFPLVQKVFKKNPLTKARDILKNKVAQIIKQY